MGGSFICDCNCVGAGTADVDRGNGTGHLSGGFDVREMDGAGFTLFMVSTHIEGPIAAEGFGREGVLTGKFFMVKTISEDGVCNIEESVG